MIERSERIGQVVELLGKSGYQTVVYDRSTDTFGEYRGQQVVNLFFIPRRGTNID